MISSSRQITKRNSFPNTSVSLNESSSDIDNDLVGQPNHLILRSDSFMLSVQVHTALDELPPLNHGDVQPSIYLEQCDRKPKGERNPPLCCKIPL